MDRQEAERLHPRELRALIRQGLWRKHTVGLAKGYVQTNLLALPRELAFNFLLFCQRNPVPCPVLEVTDVGDPRVKQLATDADLRTDLPQYRVFRQGEYIGVVSDVSEYWRDDLVTFLIGAAATFETALLDAGVYLRNIEQGRVPPVYISNIPCRAAGPFSGPMIVEMRPIRCEQVSRAVLVSSRFPVAHGAPVHIGDPAKIGIHDLNKIDFGEPTTLQEGEVPVFWACGVTSQLIAEQARPSLMITHLGGHMFVADIRSEAVAVL
jgi:uncharacterized protein YcsI (UPF0317 family)